MSALAPNADMRRFDGNVAKGQKRTHAAQQKGLLFDQRVGVGCAGFAASTLRYRA
jgi:hypothetical protein